LRGINYISMLEPAIYSSWSRKKPHAFLSLPQAGRIVSWHCHGLAWGADRKELRARFNEVTERRLYDSWIQGVDGTWARYIAPGLVAQKLSYMCKTPPKVKRIYCRNPDEPRSDWLFRQWEQKPRLGEHVWYYKILAHYTLDQLTFGGGSGAFLIQKAARPFLRRRLS
jgi:hypothetical protein